MLAGCFSGVGSKNNGADSLKADGVAKVLSREANLKPGL